MALMIRGKTTCGICGHIIELNDAAVMFPPLTCNELDPLMGFSDKAFHQRCFEEHPLKSKVIVRLFEIMTNSRPGHRKCINCGFEIIDPDDYLNLGHFSDDPTNPLHRFNFTQLHKSCIHNWTDAKSFLKLFQDSCATERWVSESMKYLLSLFDNDENE